MKSVYWCVTFLLVLSITAAGAQSAPDSGTIIVTVRSATGPLTDAQVIVGTSLVATDAQGRARLRLPVGPQTILVRRIGYRQARATVTVRADADTPLQVEMESEPVQLEDIVVTSTRAERRLADIPIRIEVVSPEEVAEKVQMSPGNVAHVLNETNGVRLQVTSPSLGGANVRIQGLRGRYTRILSDGLPLYGDQPGGLGILQIPPVDLERVEIIKGVASALYGAQALGGVVNLVSRPPTPSHEFLLNQTSRNGTDAVAWSAGRLGARWGYTLLGSAHRQSREDLDRDGWTDIAGYRRGVVRPRLFWNDSAGSSFLLTGGATVENREGGTLRGATAPDGSPFAEQLDTRRFDFGAIGRLALGVGRSLSVRTSVMQQRHRHSCKRP